MIKNSDGRDHACLSEEADYYMNKLRAYMFKKVYHNENVKHAEALENVENTICGLYNYLMDDFSALPKELQAMRDISAKEELVKDHIAGMTDRYAINSYKKIK
jgi:dGTPase